VRKMYPDVDNPHSASENMQPCLFLPPFGAGLLGVGGNETATGSASHLSAMHCHFNHPISRLVRGG